MVSGSTTVRETHSGILLSLAVKHTATWNGGGSWDAHHLEAGGTVVASCDKHLVFLQLHHGNRRVTIDEADALPGVRTDEAPE